MGTIYRTNKRQNNFVQIDRRCLDDKRLSWKAKGMLSYMLSMPDDWVFYESELMKHSKDGRESFRNGITELLQYGYMVKVKNRNQRGQFNKTEILVYEIPQNTTIKKTTGGKTTGGKTTGGKPTDGKTIYGQHDSTNTDSTNTELEKITNKNFTNTKQRPSDAEKYLENFSKELPNNLDDRAGLQQLLDRVIFKEELLVILDTYHDERYHKMMLGQGLTVDKLPSIYSPDEVVTGFVPPSPQEPIEVPGTMVDVFDMMFDES